jgi:hypothetical protein
MTAPIETKVKAGTLTGSLTGLAIWALMAYVPAFHDGVPEPVVAIIPVVLSVVGGAIAAWLAPHTSRSVGSGTEPGTA